MTYEIHIDSKSNHGLKVTVADMRRKEVIRFETPPVKIYDQKLKTMAIAKTMQAVSDLIDKQERKPLK